MLLRLLFRKKRFRAPLVISVLTGVMALAATGWRPIGVTAGGNKVSVSTISVSKNGLRTTWVRVEYKEPTKLPQGGPFVELRARVRFNCASGATVTNSEWFYSRGRGGKPVVSRKAGRDDQFGQTSEGDFGNIAREYVCKSK